MTRRRLVQVLVSAIVCVVFSACGASQDVAQLEALRAEHGYGALLARLGTAESDEGFTFVVLGDSRSDTAVARRVFAQAASEEPAFILNTGDIVRHGTQSEYLAHHLPLVKGIAPVPMIPVPGNHEEGPNRDFAGFKTLYGADQFVFDYGGARFVGINNSERVALSVADMKFLKDALSEPGPRHRFVIMHIPPDYMTSAGGRSFKWRANAFRALLKDTGVDHVFVGHIHGFATELVGGIPYTITGGAGAPLADTLGDDGNVRNYVVVRVSPDGVSTEVVRGVGDGWERSDF